MNAEHITACLTLPRGLFPYRRYVCVPNVSWGLDLDGEADFVALSDAGYLTEVEIKITAVDFRRDADKWKHRKQVKTPLVSAFYYAMPEALWPKIESEFPEYAGLILAGYANRRYYARKAIAAPARPCRKLTDAERYQLARLGTMRYWSRVAEADATRACAADLVEARAHG